MKILLADDHALLRQGLRQILSEEFAQAEFRETGTTQETLACLLEGPWDVVVLDLFMPGSDGFEVLRTLERTGNRVASVVLTGSDSQNDYVQVVRLGARGLVLKADDPQKLFAAIRAVAEGDLAFSDEIAHTILDAMVSDQPAVPSSMARLSERERQISYMVARGMRNRDIATDLSISENTVKRHLQSIFSKTGSRDRLELAVLALSEIGKAAA